MTTRKEAIGSVSPTLPRPGDYIRCRVHTRAWETETRRGYEGLEIKPGDQGLVVAVKYARNSGTTFRLLLIIKETLAIVSVVEGRSQMNWDILTRPTE